MKLIINDKVKATVVSLGAFRVFGDKKVLSTEADRVKRFNEVWDKGLRSSIEEAIRVMRIVEPDVVKDRLKKQFRTSLNPEQYVENGKTLYEFTYEVLCVVQTVLVREPDEYEINQLWTFTYPNANPELFCFPFDKSEDKTLYLETARKIGKDPYQLAKEAVIAQMHEIINKLETNKAILEQQVERLEKDLRKSNIAYYRRMIEELKERLDHDIPETTGDNSWQNWIYKNNWLFGTQYGQPIQKQRVGFNNIPDFLFPTLDGFFDILEIKKPDINPIRADKSHPGAFAWSPEVTQAIGQVVTYLHEIELHQLELSQIINRTYALTGENVYYIVKPRAFILAGRSNGWSSQEIEAFRKLNYSLNGIQVLTYDDLLRKAESLVSLYTKEIR